MWTITLDHKEPEISRTIQARIPTRKIRIISKRIISKRIVLSSSREECEYTQKEAWKEVLPKQQRARIAIFEIKDHGKESLPSSQPVIETTLTGNEANLFHAIWDAYSGVCDSETLTTMAMSREIIWRVVSNLRKKLRAFGLDIAVCEQGYLFVGSGEKGD